MKNIAQNLKLIALAVILSFGISFASAWVLPTAAPPNGNADAPITTGGGQTINGNLTLTGSTVGGVYTPGVLAVGTVAKPATLTIAPASNLVIPGATAGYVLTAADASGKVGWAVLPPPPGGGATPDLDAVLGAGSAALGKDASILVDGSGAGGTMYATSLMAKEFKDADDITYVVNPAGSSNLNSVTGNTATFGTIGFGESYGAGTGFTIKEVPRSEIWYFRCQVPRGSSTATSYVAGYDKAGTYDADGYLISISCNWDNGAGFPPWPHACGGVGTMGGAPSPYLINNIMDRYGWNKGIGKVKLRTGMFAPSLALVTPVNLCGSSGADGTQGYLVLNYVNLEVQ